MSPAAPAPQHGRVPELGGATDVHSSVVLAAAVSVPLSLLVALCLMIRRCRKRGRGTMAASARSGRQGDKNWSVGDILGRSKDGFKPLNTDEGDGMLDEDSESEVGSITLLAPYKSAALVSIIIKPQKSHTPKLQYKPLSFHFSKGWLFKMFGSLTLMIMVEDNYSRSSSSSSMLLI